MRGGCIGRVWLLLGAVVAGCGGAASPDAEFAALQGKSTCTVELNVTGMTCPDACPLRAAAALESVQGVRAADVSYESQSATVQARETACTEGGYEQMRSALSGAGYGCELVGVE